MQSARENRADESARLRACVRDLVAMSSMGAWWLGRSPKAIARSISELLATMVGVDTTYVELYDREAATRCVATGGSGGRDLADNGAMRFATYPIGIGGELGRFTVGSTRIGFPDRFEALMLRTTANTVGVAIRHAELLTRHERAERQLAARAAQQAGVARLGFRALTGISFDTILTEAVAIVRETLRVDRCEVFELLSEEQLFLLRVGDGWADSSEPVTMSAGVETPPGFAVRSSEPLVIDDLRSDERFTQQTPLHRLGAVSGVSAVIHGPRGPFGVLGAYVDEPRTFTRDDVFFQQSVANLLAATLARREAELERDALLDAAAKAQTEAEQQSRTKSHFLGMLSHELRTPLNAIGGYAQLIETGIRGPVNDDQKRDLARIRRSQQYLLGVISNVLSFLRLGSGRVLYDLSDVIVDNLVDGVEELTRPMIEAKTLRWERTCPTPDVVVRADRDKLQQILLNLVSNAIKFTDAGGAVCVGCDAGKDRVRIHVRDTGWGIPTDRLSAVFEPFTRLHDTARRPTEGAGLGLTISRDFARGMGGDLEVNSEPGNGSTFSIWLPRAR